MLPARSSQIWRRSALYDSKSASLRGSIFNERAIGPWPLAGLAEHAGADLKLSTVLRTIGDVFDGEFNPPTDVGESRLVGLEALTNAFED